MESTKKQNLNLLVDFQKKYRIPIVKCENELYDLFNDRFITESKALIAENLPRSNDPRASILQYKNDFDKLCEFLNVAPYVVRYKTKYLALYLMHRCLETSKMPSSTEELDDFEKKHVNFRGPINHISENPITDVATVTYDINSAYAYNLHLSSYAWTSARGTFKTLQEIDAKKLFKTLGYYHIRMDKPPFWLKTKTNQLWVTNYDILTFMLNGNEYELLNNENNAYEYETSKTCSGLRAMIEQLYAYRIDNKNNVVKSVLNQLYSCTYEKDTQSTFKCVYSAEEVKSHETTECVMDEFGNLALQVLKSQTVDQTLPKFYIGRNKPFFYSFSIYQLTRRIFKPLNDKGINIIRVATDSITCAKNDVLDNLISNRLGDLKYEAHEWTGQKGLFVNTKSWIHE